MRWLNNRGPKSNVPCCVILAAGEGRRLSILEKGPKPTHEVLGLSLGERTILACMAAGVSRFIVVLGSQAEAVRAHFAQVSMRRGCAVEFVVAADWHLGNGISALAAKDSILDDRFLLVMADHLVSTALIQQVLHTALGAREVCLAVDQNTARVFDLDDATKVQFKHGTIECIGKHLDVWNAVDTGVFLATPALFDALADAAAQGQYPLSRGGRKRAAMAGCRYAGRPPRGETSPPRVLGQERRRWLYLDPCQPPFIGPTLGSPGTYTHHPHPDYAG